jgi:hypothetical protein
MFEYLTTRSVPGAASAGTQDGDATPTQGADSRPESRVGGELHRALGQDDGSEAEGNRPALLCPRKACMCLTWPCHALRL